MANKKISYTEREFAGLRQDLINYTQQYYPDLINNFNDASIFSVLMDLNAAIGDNLNYHIDRSIQETVLQYAQQRISVFNIARTYGLKIPGYRPSVTVLNLSITVGAVNGDKEDTQYLGVLRAGSQFLGAGTVFENLYDVDFSSEYSALGFQNRIKIPLKNSQNTTVAYRITKQEVVVNGTTKVFKKPINSIDVVPFYNLFLPERNILNVSAIIQKEGTNYQTVPGYSDFINSTSKWYEVDALAQDSVFLEDPTKPVDNTGIKVGKYFRTDNRFITEYTPEGFMRVQFGGGTTTPNEQLKEFTRIGIPLNIQNFQNNIGLGLTVQPNTTLFIQYRVGGGLASNVGVGAINQVGTIDFVVNGQSNTENQKVIQSLTVNNVTAAIGGGNPPTIEEIRNMVTFNFAAQKRAVTINDYKSIIDTMPGKFGAPSKAAVSEKDNKILVKVLSLDSGKKLTQTVSSNLIKNIATYLSNYRMINDYVSVEVAKVIDLEFEIFVVLEGGVNQGQVITQVINSVADYMQPSNREMGQNLNVSDIRRLIQNVAGVSTLANLNIYNKVGGQYSSSETSQRYIDKQTKQIELIDETIFAEPDQIYQVRFPNKDIKVRVKNLTTVDFG
jgi:hypothetical protein